MGLKQPRQMDVNSTYARMRMMDAGETIRVPVDKWGAARSAASVLKRQYGALFKVNIDREENIVKVTRLEDEQ